MGSVGGEENGDGEKFLRYMGICYYLGNIWGFIRILKYYTIGCIEWVFFFLEKLNKLIKNQINYLEKGKIWVFNEE